MCEWVGEIENFVSLRVVSALVVYDLLYDYYIIILYYTI